MSLYLVNDLILRIDHLQRIPLPSGSDPVGVALLPNINLVLNRIPQLVDALGRCAPAAGMPAALLQAGIGAAAPDGKVAVQGKEGDIPIGFDFGEIPRIVFTVAAVDELQIGIERGQSRQPGQAVAIGRRRRPKRPGVRSDDRNRPLSRDTLASVTGRPLSKRVTQAMELKCPSLKCTLVGRDLGQNRRVAIPVGRAPDPDADSRIRLRTIPPAIS